MSSVQEKFRSVSQPVTISETETSAHRNSPRDLTTRDCPRVTVRLSMDDHARLTELADGMALSTYIRAKVLSKQLSRRKHRSTTSAADKQVLAKILGLLGQSRISSNLNQLAYQANIGALEIDDTTQEQISEAYDHIVFLRQSLIKALGLSG